MSITLDPTRTCVRCNLPLIVGWCAEQVISDDYEGDAWQHGACDHAATTIAFAFVAATPVTFAKPAPRSLAYVTVQAANVLEAWLRHHPDDTYEAAAEAFGGTDAQGTWLDVAGLFDRRVCRVPNDGPPPIFSAWHAALGRIGRADALGGRA